MKKLRLSVFFEPGTVHIDGIKIRAEQAIEMGLISNIPEITTEESTIKPFWYIILNIKPEDFQFWRGFYMGKDWCINNRPLTVGCP